MKYFNRQLILTLIMTLVVWIVCAHDATTDKKTYETRLQRALDTDDFSGLTNLLVEIEITYDPTWKRISIDRMHNQIFSHLKKRNPMQYAAVVCEWLERPLPGDPDRARAAVTVKEGEILFKTFDDLFAQQNAPVLALARFVGNVRSRIVENYERPPGSLNIVGATPEQMREYQEKRTRLLPAARLQDQLRSVDGDMTAKLLKECARFHTSDPADRKLLNQIADAARLTSVEYKNLLNR